MKDRIEKFTLLAGAIWNIITAILTIVGYSNWFKKEGFAAFEKVNKVDYFSTSLVDSLVSIIMVFGLFMFMLGIINLFVSHAIGKEVYNKKIFIWLMICTIIHFISFDVIGILLYLVTITLYGARNRAYKLSMQ